MDSIDEQIRAAVELRALIREAHAAVKDLRREVKEAKAAIAADLDRAPREVGDLLAGVGEMCNKLLADWIDRVRDKSPLTMMCPKCGVILAVLSGPDERCVCSGCGAKFRTRSPGVS